MAIFRVYAEYVTTCYIDVEANDEVEAHEKAEKIDGGEFTELERNNWLVLFDDITEQKAEA
jgi:hypothetical protein